MNNQKNKALTFIFSLIPGAGHMYIGLMRRGISLMGIFCGVIMLLSWFSAGALALILPVLWFYSFFDLWNKVGLTPEEFANVRDYFLFTNGDITDARSFIHRHAKGLGVVAIAFGICLLWKDVFSGLIYDSLGQSLFVSMILDRIYYGLPSAIIGVVIIIIGFRLIARKKKELDGGDGQ